VIIFSVNSEITRNDYFLDLTVATSFLLFVVLINLLIVSYKNNKLRDDLILNINKKNGYLEHAAKILRHDMHSGINTYIPRGVKSLERRVSDDMVKQLKIEAPLKMIKEGLSHTQKVYEGVFEFTNLVKKDAKLEKNKYDTKEILKNYLSSTAYKSNVILNDNLPVISVNKALFCTAIDNLIRNGLKYNDSSKKFVKVYEDNGYICVEDNGRGMTQEEFEYLSLPYKRKKDQKEQGSGLGLNICIAILEEHRFKVSSESMINGKGDFYDKLREYEIKHENYPNMYVFNKKSLEQSAKENNYYGRIKIIKASRQKNKFFVTYKEGDKTKEISKGTKIKIKYK
jgi:light-regulated signal transduction histidine kinase (bacteriophytochrome)